MAPAVFGEESIAVLQTAYLRGEYAEVVSRADGMWREAPAGQRDQLLYLKGMSALKLGDQGTAVQTLERLVRDFRNSPYRPHGWLGMGRAQEISQEWLEAQKTFEAILRDSNAAAIWPQAALELGKVRRQLGLWEEAKGALEQVIAQAPKTPQAAQAREILKDGDFHFVIQVGAFGQRGNAERLAREMQRRGFEATISAASVEGRTFHRVQVGSYSNRLEADTEAERIRKAGFPARIVP